MGWSEAAFWALDEREQLDWMAHDEYLMGEYRSLLHGLKKHEDGAVIVKDFGSYIDLILRRL